MNVSGVARPQGGWPPAVFYPFGHPTPYASASDMKDDWEEMQQSMEKLLPLHRDQISKVNHLHVPNANFSFQNSFSVF
jgi:hypothetical protein